MRHGVACFSTVKGMSLSEWLPGGTATVLELVGVVLVVLGWFRWNRSVVALGVGSAAAMAGVLGWTGAPGRVQAVVAVVGGIGLTGLFWRWNGLLAQGNTLPPGVGAVRLVGLQAKVRREVDARGVAPIGQVFVAGETWGAWTADGGPIPIGSSVTVVEVKGTRLVVTGLHPASKSVVPTSIPRSTPTQRPPSTLAHPDPESESLS